MSVRCADQDSFKVRMTGTSRVRGHLVKKVKLKAKPQVTTRFKSLASLTIVSFRRGLGETSETFSEPRFGAASFSSVPSALPKIMRGDSDVSFNAQREFTKKPPRILPEQLFDIDSVEYKQSGLDGIPDSVYDPATSNNHIYTYTGSPQTIHRIFARCQSGSNLRASMNVPITNFAAKFDSKGTMKIKFFEKMKGHAKKLSLMDFASGFIQKLYPIKDEDIEHDGISLVDEKLGNSGIYRSIDEGVFVGNVLQNGGTGYFLSDKNSSYITPSSINTAGSFQYKFEVTNPTMTPMESVLVFRAAAPLFNYDGNNPPKYDIKNIKFLDPSGDLIAKYKDISVIGEQDYTIHPNLQRDWFTLVTEPEEFYAGTGLDRFDYPIVNENSGYLLAFDVDATCFHEPFDKKFDGGFEDNCDLTRKFVPSSPNDYLSLDGAPLSTRTQGYQLNPTNALRISSIEIVNEGLSSGLLHDGQLNIVLMPQPTGQRLERALSPTRVLTSSYNNNIYPTGIVNVWKSSADADGNVYYTSSDNAEGVFKDRLANRFVDGWITLDSITPVSESGKLQLLYKNAKPQSVKEKTGGAFFIGQRYGGSDFGTAKVAMVEPDDSVFIVEEITLRISAKKGSTLHDDFPIDVVGYSDDGVLAITSEQGGFLQNAEVGSGIIPSHSGFLPTDDLGISNHPISDKDAYFQESIIEHAAGDHYKIGNPVVTGINFETYDVPLKIYNDSVRLGRSKDYSMSTYFESLYLDIYPIPSGASIQRADLIIKYAPAGAFPLTTAGYLSKKFADRTGRLYPDAKKDTDSITNSMSHGLSLLENVPHGYTQIEDTLKTNYSRRWRGCTGQVDDSPFDAEAFDFSYERNTKNQPFLLGYFDFNKVVNNAFMDDFGDVSISGLFNSNISDSLTRNIGLRFNNSSLFDSNIRSYKTIDWCPTGHELEGKILDAYDNVLRCSGVDGYLNFGDTPTSEGFTVYTKFSPDVTVSGTSPNYNLWNSGAIFSKWDSGSDLEYALGYKDGYLTAYAKEKNSSNIIEISDTLSYDNYQYPLGVVLTYNQRGDNKLRLYTKNEIVSDVDILRAESNAFVMHSGTSDLTFSYSAGSGVGFNAFISEIGISDINASGHANIIDSTKVPDASVQEHTILDFFRSNSINFWDGSDNLFRFVDEKTDDWKLGSFKYCQFGPDFDVMSKRIGTDYIYHSFHNHGKTYADLTNIDLPPTVNASGLAYHTQIENDMIRVQLSGREDRFYAVSPRIVKDLPRSYLFAEDSLLVNTILQHSCDDNIVWPDGKVGAKLIASLYAPTKESAYSASTNFGLVSRDVHYVTPEDCWIKIKSRFTLEQYTDSDSEPWAFFDKRITKKEFSENYFGRDIDEMFVQYDLVYPSGSYEHSEIKIHSLDIKMDDIILFEDKSNEHLNVYTSGDAYSAGSLNMTWAEGAVKEVIAAGGFGSVMFGNHETYTLPDLSVNLYTSGNIYTQHSSDMNIYASGWSGGYANLNLHNGGGLAESGILNLSNLGGFSVANNLRDPFTLYSEGLFSDAIQSLSSVNLYTRGINASDQSFNTNADSFSIFILGGHGATNFPITVNNSINFYVSGPDENPISISDSLALEVQGRPILETITSNINLYTYHVQPVGKEEGQLEAFTWNGQNYGFEIYVDDNQYASIPANDEIRGVNTMCYGDCDTNAGVSCTETAIVTHDTTWYVPECAEGGVIRPVRVYSNVEAGYDKEYYGIRKFTNLIPNAPYNLVITGQSAGSEIIDVPRELQEWNYGKSESSGIIPPEVNYSGIQLLEKISNRFSDNKFGSSVKIVQDMLAVGVPYADNIVGVNDTLNSDLASRPVESHGKIYVYRRNLAPSGYDWSEQDDQAQWAVEQEIVLPTGWRRDYFTTTTATFTDDSGQTLPFTGTIRNWINSGEGRELGHSVDATKVGDKEVIVAGGPGSKWTRTFSPVTTTPVSIGLMVFNNELQPNVSPWQNVLKALKDRDILYRYFADPAVEFDIKIMILEPHLGSDIPFESSEEFNTPQPDFVTKHLTTRHWNLSTTSQDWIDAEATMLQEMKNIFHDTFSTNASALHNGVPPLMGFFVDDSFSLGSDRVGYYTNGFKGALNKFIDYYYSYSKANGVKDFGSGGAGTGDATEGYASVTVSSSESNWVSQSIRCLRDLTDIPTLKAANKHTLIATNLGTFNVSASEFNNPPPSGGAVYVFEKDNATSSFELRQEIQSPVTYSDDVSDRFGHDVAISKDGNIIVIGSPYTESAVQVFQRQSDYESRLQTRIFNNLPSFLSAESNKEIIDATFGEGYTLNNKYNNEKAPTGTNNALKLSIFNEMSESLKFMFYRTYNIKPYSKIKSLSYSEVYPDRGGAWSQLYSRYIPTPRLGYSVDTNDDGSMIAIGCPTDSLGERDNTITWFRYDTAYGNTQPWQWQNYTNAGAVRLIESRDYYPHRDKAVEFYKYGNLHEDLASENDKYLYFENIKQMLSSRGIDYSRTSFAEDQKIPEDAGLAFIITPAVDSNSDEIINNIKEWLSKGDRHLVLVADDPRYEGDGIFFDSTNIINTILQRLDINLQVHPARDSREALIESTNAYFNVQSSFNPAKSTSVIARRGSRLKGYGVGDIKHYREDIVDLYSCSLPFGMKKSSDPFAILEQIDGVSSSRAGRKLLYRDMHDKCNLPIKHEGDLRAEYKDQCVYVTPKGETSFITYHRNIGYAYGTHNTSNWGCNRPEIPKISTNPNDRPKNEPVPILAAYESVKKTINVSAVPERERIERYVVGYDTTTNISFDYGNTPYSGISFLWQADLDNEGSYSGINFVNVDHNINDINSDSLFFDPLATASANGISDGLLMAKASTPFKDVEESITVGKFDMVNEERYRPGAVENSQVVLIATTYTERKDVLLASDGDRNLLAYYNILAYGSKMNQNGFYAKIAQVGGFTDRKSYKDGYIKSDIAFQMYSMGIDSRDLNVDVDKLTAEYLEYDIAWIANTDKMPSDEDIQHIKNFLDLGNKRLIITYGQEPNKETKNDGLTPFMIRAANVAAYICKELGISMKPKFLNGKNRYAQRSDVVTNSSTRDLFSAFTLYGNARSRFPSGGASFITNVPPYNRLGIGTTLNHEIIPIQRNNSSLLGGKSNSISDIEIVSKGKPRLHTGISKATFNVPDHNSILSHDLGREVEDDLYLFRLFFTVQSVTETEIEPIEVYVENGRRGITFSGQGTGRTPTRIIGGIEDKVGNSTSILDYSDDNLSASTQIKQAAWKYLEASSTPKTYEVDVQLPSGGQIDMYFTGTKFYRTLEENPDQKRTTRLLGVSGVRLPLETKTNNTSVPIFEHRTVSIPSIPGFSYEQDLIRQISTDSSKYCAENNSEVCAEADPAGYGIDGDAPVIADGPVVVAQQVYDQGGFFSGYNKSRVTVISDASIIQGRNILNEDEFIVDDLANFLASLYPRTYQYYQDDFFGSDEFSQTKFYPNAYKIISPERASPSRLVNALPDNSGLNARFGGYDSAGIGVDKYSDTEGKKDIETPPGREIPYQPFDGMLSLMEAEDAGKFRKRPDAPRLPPSHYFSIPPYTYGGLTRAEYEQKWYVDEFLQYQTYWSSTSKIQDVYNGQTYVDAGLSERIPPLLRAAGHDHLDFDVFNSGYPGDLFGYKVTIHKNKLYVGSPFTPYNNETITPWSGILDNGSLTGVEVGHNGGAGAVYVIEKVGNVGDGVGSIQGSSAVTTGIPWKTTSKFRPDELGVGFMNTDATALSGIIGTHSYTDSFIENNAFVSDMFGADIVLDGDLMAISAPGHDFNTFFEINSGEFVNKAFNEQFAIETRTKHDFAKQSVRDAYPNSGLTVLNNGAVFTYENKIDDWGSKQQAWTQIQKLNPLEDLDLSQGSSENNYFGTSLSLYRSRRSDSDYTLAIGSKNHSVPTSGNIGAVYTNDAMLRKLRPGFSHPDTSLKGKVFGVYRDKDEYIEFDFTNGTVPNATHRFEGLVFSNEQGEIFIEASGQDKVERGYVTHRPFIKQIRGVYEFGSGERARLNLFNEGAPFNTSGIINLFSRGPETGNVYNNVGLYGISALDSSGILQLYASGIQNLESSGILPLSVSGSLSGGTGILNLYGYGGF